MISLALKANAEAQPDRGPLGLGKTASELEVRRRIDSLSDEEKCELLAVMWIGRRDAGITPGSFATLVEQASNQLDHVGSYMESKGPLAEYLAEGVRLLRLRS